MHCVYVQPENKSFQGGLLFKCFVDWTVPLSFQPRRVVDATPYFRALFFFQWCVCSVQPFYHKRNKSDARDASVYTTLRSPCSCMSTSSFWMLAWTFFVPRRET